MLEQHGLTTLGTMPVAAGMVTVAYFTACGTGKDLTTQIFSTTMLDGAHGGSLGRQQLPGMFLAVSGTVLSKDIRQF